MNKDLEARDLLMEDLCGAQASHGKLPTVTDNAKYISSVLEDLDRAEKAKAPDKTERTENAIRRQRDGAFDRELRKRAQRHGLTLTGYEIERGPKAPLAHGGSPFELRSIGIAEKRMRARIRLLNSLPEWQARMRSINPLALSGTLGHEKREHAAEIFRRIIADSEVLFGPWWKAPARPLWFGGKACPPIIKT